MASESVRRIVSLRLGIVCPDLQNTIATSSDEAPLWSLSTRVPTYQAPWSDSWRPAHGVHTHSVRLEDACQPISFSKFEDGDLAIGRGAGEQTPEFMR